MTNIKIVKHKHWNTKKIYSKTGYLLARYLRIPKTRPPKCRWTNDNNQNLCGGWHYYNDNNQEILNRVIAKTKPAGTIYADRSTIKEYVKQLKKAKHKHIWFMVGDHWGYANMAILYICNKVKLKDLVDIGKLKQFYFNNRILQTALTAYAEKDLKDFYEMWDSDNLDLAVKGLVLGYPIENTLACYLCNVR